MRRSCASARAAGETEQRVYLLAAWREAPCYSERERAALGWTDALTRISAGAPLDSAREALKAHFSEEEQVKLTPNAQGLLFVPLAAQRRYPVVWTPNNEYAGDRVKLAKLLDKAKT